MKLVFSSLLSIPITTTLSLCCDCLSFQPHGKQQRATTVIRYLGFEIRPNGQIFSLQINQRRCIRVRYVKKHNFCFFTLHYIRRIRGMDKALGSRNQRNGQSIWQKFTKSHCSCRIARVKSKTEMTMPGLAGGETFGQEGDDCELPPEGSVSVTGGVVALGKFDALHIGHRELAIQASKSGTPFLVSFVGIAEVLGWEPRAPIVAKCDRKRVLSSWAPYCGNVAPAEFHVQFSSVRHLTPQQFVEKLAKELGVRGVVAGENYRFGYKAAGDASELVRLCEEYGMGAFIVSSVMDNNQLPGVSISMDSKDKGQVSSTRVRHALALGDMEYVSKLLGRNHRLMLLSEQGFVSNRNRISAPKSCLLNLPPKEGLYENCSLLVDNNVMVSCTAMIDSTHIHVESIDASILKQIPFQDCRQIGIEFGSSVGC